MKKRVIVVGAGVGGLAAACILGQAGYDVTVYEKNDRPGGRADSFRAKGFRFDSGPSWFLMPDIFEHFFSLLGEDMNSLLDLKRLDPSYRVFFKDELLGALDIKSDADQTGLMLEAMEPGAHNRFLDYLEKAARLYDLAKNEVLYKNHDSRRDFFTPRLAWQSLRMNTLISMQSYVAKYFTDNEVRKILLYPTAFLGVSPRMAPALYSVLNHADFNQGVFYPMGGMNRLVEKLVELAEARGAKIAYSQPVGKIAVKYGKAKGVVLENGEMHEADIVISNADLAYTEMSLLEEKNRTYSEKYWEKRTMAPSALVMHLGVKKTYANLRHHNLVFSRNWDAHNREIFKSGKLPADPSFYVSAPTKSDPKAAPKGHENLQVIVPLPASLHFDRQQIEDYADTVIQTMEKSLRLSGLRKNIIYKRCFCALDFKNKFNSYKGSALGLAHTLSQTAGRPANYSKKVKGLYYVGANTYPGIGLPMCLISAELAYKRITGNTSAKQLDSI